MSLQDVEIFAVGSPVRKRHIQVRTHLRQRIVAFPMHGKREDRIDVLENRRRAVTLMHVEIDDGCALDEPFGTQSRDGDRDIVEHAKSLPHDPRTHGACLRRDYRPGRLSSAARAALQRSAGGETRATPKLVRPWQTEAPLLQEPKEPTLGASRDRRAYARAQRSRYRSARAREPRPLRADRRPSADPSRAGTWTWETGAAAAARSRNLRDNCTSWS
jgi:hypothetical protein